MAEARDPSGGPERARRPKRPQKRPEPPEPRAQADVSSGAPGPPIDAELRLTRERLEAATEELERIRLRLGEGGGRSGGAARESHDLRTVNAALRAVNGELAGRVSALARVNADLGALLESAQIATVFLDGDLRVKGFTPSVADVLGPIGGELLDRPISARALRLDYPELEHDVRRVLRTLGAVEREVGASAGEARFLVRVLPYRSAEDVICGVVVTFNEVTDLARAGAQAQAENRRMRAILDGVGHGFYTLDGEMRFTWVNRSAQKLWGLSAAEMLGRPLPDLLPEGGDELVAAHRRALERRAPVETELLWPGRDCWMVVGLHPAETGLAAVLRDVTEGRWAAARQKTLLTELQHRVKNILAVVRSITARTIEASHGLEDFAAHFDGRLSALARTQGALARHAAGEVHLDEIVREELLTHAAREGEQAEIKGPPVRLNQLAAETFTLAVHELATNAVKYGALSTPSGRVAVTWRVMTTSAGEKLTFEWRESGVAVVDPRPPRIGFGRDLIERGLPYDLPGAATAIDFAPGGLQCVIELPLGKYSARASAGVEDRTRGTHR